MMTCKYSPRINIVDCNKHESDKYWTQWIVNCFPRHDVSISITSKHDVHKRLDRYDGVVITGSASHVFEKHKWIERVAEYIHKAVENDVPVLGICFGSQILAETFGGKVENTNSIEAGWIAVNVEPNMMHDPIFHDMPSPFQSFSFHMDRVSRLPDNSTLLAKNDFAVQGFRINKKYAYGFQFHPEVKKEDGMGFLNSVGSELKTFGRSSYELNKGARSNLTATRIFRNFVDIVQRHVHDQAAATKETGFEALKASGCSGPSASCNAGAGVRLCRGDSGRDDAARGWNR